ncbi:hypothetical protein PFISCL1PPCAC_25231, partial [Pristionchus fissidentatus]
ITFFAAFAVASLISGAILFVKYRRMKKMREKLKDHNDDDQFPIKEDDDGKNEEDGLLANDYQQFTGQQELARVRTNAPLGKLPPKTYDREKVTTLIEKNDRFRNTGDKKFKKNWVTDDIVDLINHATAFSAERPPAFLLKRRGPRAEYKTREERAVVAAPAAPA